MNTTTLTKKTTVRELVAVFQQAEADIREAFRLVCGAEKSLNDSFSLESFASIRVDVNSYSRGSWDVDHAIDEVRRSAWRTIVERLELRRILSIKRWEDLHREMADKKPPPITEQTVSAFAAQYSGSMQTLHEESVREVFELLRPRGTKAKALKTNTEFEIGKKVILPYMVENAVFLGNFRVNYHHQQDLTALENVMSVLDGKGGVNKTHSSELRLSIENTPLASNGRGETEYFRFRACKNGNLHIEFKRLDLLADLNRIGGGNRLHQAEVAA